MEPTVSLLKNSSLKYASSSPVRGRALDAVVPPVKVTAHTTAARAATAKRAAKRVWRLAAMRVIRSRRARLPDAMVVAERRGFAGRDCTGISASSVRP